ncbi:hypothetical protein MC885_003458 [Smutsia gigantea]|nr:hypothetical protein MC885_003458 [Smutsia gigantea]
MGTQEEPCLGRDSSVFHHQKTGYIFYLFYKRKAISRELYEYCIKEGYADKNLIAKWKKQGYENLCCLRCIQTQDTDFGTNCTCQVPKSKLEMGRITECTHCAAGAALAEALGPLAPLPHGLSLPVMPSAFLGAAPLTRWYPRPELDHSVYM